MSLVASPALVSSAPATVLVESVSHGGLSNLTPARSRLFKLIGKDGVKRWSCSGNKHIWWLTYAKESEKRSNATVAKLEVIKK